LPTSSRTSPIAVLAASACISARAGAQAASRRVIFLLNAIAPTAGAITASNTKMRHVKRVS
jgi:hypothetical protein